RLRLVDDDQKDDHKQGDSAKRHQNIIFDDIADRQDEQREPRQRKTHAAENVAELGHDECQQQNHDADRDDQNGDGIEQRGLDLALDLLRLFRKFSQPFQDHFQNTAQFAGLDHVDKQTVENFRM